MPMPLQMNEGSPASLYPVSVSIPVQAVLFPADLDDAFSATFVPAERYDLVNDIAGITWLFSCVGDSYGVRTIDKT